MSKFIVTNDKKNPTLYFTSNCEMHQDIADIAKLSPNEIQGGGRYGFDDKDNIVLFGKSYDFGEFNPLIG